MNAFGTAASAVIDSAAGGAPPARLGRCVLVCLAACLASLPAEAESGDGPAPPQLGAPPNPPEGMEVPISAHAALAHARGWASRSVAASAAPEDTADVLVVTGDWANLSPPELEKWRRRPEGRPALLLATSFEIGLDRAIAAIRSGFDGIVLATGDLPDARSPAYRDIAALAAELRRHSPDFLILLDLNDRLPSPEGPLPDVDGLVLRHVLADTEGSPYTVPAAYARLTVLKSLLGRNIPVLVAEKSADISAGSRIADELTAMGAIPFVSK